MDLKTVIVLFSLSSVLAYEDVTIVEWINTHNFVFLRTLIERVGLKEVLSQTGNNVSHPTGIEINANIYDKYHKRKLTVRNLDSKRLLIGVLVFHIQAGKNSITLKKQ